MTGALAGTRGESLLALDLPGLQAELERLPSVASARFDRAFPHTLRVIVVPRAAGRRPPPRQPSWLVAASGRVIKPPDRGARPGLPRIWLRPESSLASASRSAAATRGRSHRRPLVRAPLPAALRPSATSPAS